MLHLERKLELRVQMIENSLLDIGYTNFLFADDPDHCAQQTKRSTAHPLWVAERLGEGSRGFQPNDCDIHHETGVAERRLKPGMTRSRPAASSVAPRRNPSIICQTVG